MIESSFSCSNTWDLEPFQDLSEVPFLNYNLESLERDYLQFDSFSSLNESSSHSSDYESIYFDDIDKILPVADSFISELLEENYTGFQDDWVFPQDDENSTSPVQTTSTSIKNSPKKAKRTLSSLTKKSWSKMSKEEQLETLHSLSKIVTTHMGIREQIKVIKIIDPTVTISPDDKEFALDISRLNDAKLRRIQELLRKHKYSLSNSKKFKNSPKNISQQKSSLSSKMFSGRTISKTKRKQKKQKSSTNENVRQKRKLELHGQKEIQSGLFVYEKVIKLSNPLEDEDVNILE